MSVLGLATLVATTVFTVWLTHKIVSDEMAWRYPRLAWLLTWGLPVAGIFLTLLGAQALGLSAGTWVLCQGEYLLAPGGV